MIPVSLHVVFTPSASGELRRALALAGRSDRVVEAFDNLSFGPINPPDGALRARWVLEELGWSDWEEVVGEATLFWKEALSPGRKVAWISRRTTCEYANFLEWLWRLGDEPCEVVDLTDVNVSGYGDPPTLPRLAISLALLSHPVILDNGLLDRAEPLSSTDRKRYQQIWRQLRADNAALRVLTADGLVSAPISYFDPLVLSCAKSAWQKTARVVAEAMGKDFDSSFVQTGDLLLIARIRILVTTGLLEARGDLSDIHRSEVRLPAELTSL